MEIIATYGTIFLVLAIIFGFYMTWGIGANDVANAMGTSVGSGAITVMQAIIIAAIFEFAGAFIAGGNVTSTIRKGIIDPASVVAQPEILVFGMLAALLAAAIWLMIASTRGWPVSTTHTIVGALVGFAIAGIGVDAVQWGKISMIAASWIISPALGGFLAYMLMMSIRKFILNTDHPFESAKRVGPVYVFLVGFIISLVTIFKGLKHLKLELSAPESFMWALIFGLVVAFIGWILIHKIEVDKEADRDYHFASVEKIFVPMMIFTACAMAFAHGSNDVANGIGPLAAIASILKSGGEVAQTAELPLWILIMGGTGIVLGLVTMGYKVMQTIGTRGYRGAGLQNRPAGFHHAYCSGCSDWCGPGARCRRYRPQGDWWNCRFLGHYTTRRWRTGSFNILYFEGYVYLNRALQMLRYITAEHLTALA